LEHDPSTVEFDAVVIGGGPAGSAIGRLLAGWGHSVLILTKLIDETRGLAESLPPSSRKPFASLGVLDAIDRAGFCRTTGNTVWWGSREGRVEHFGTPDGEPGFQVFRPELDRLLLESARDAGASVCVGATVRRVRLDGEVALVEYESAGLPARATCRFAIDCSGRAGLIARQGFRRYEPRYGMQAFIGVWNREGGWDLPDETHTVVETFEDGWEWSVPISRHTRHVVVMVDGTKTRLSRGPTLESTYRAELAKAKQLDALRSGAVLQHTWACDASLYSSSVYGDSNFLLVGDAGSFIDPLSSFGVKKALASASVGAVTVHTCLRHRDREALALQFFSALERQMFTSNLRRSREYAREACRRHPHPFWASRADVDVEEWSEEPDEDAAARSPDVQSAFRMLKESPALALVFAGGARLEKRALIRGREIVLEDAVALPGVRVAVRFFAGVDLLTLAEMAAHFRQVPDLFEAYCRSQPAVPLPDFLLGLSLLVAKGILTPRTQA